jgi:hypothetical protein
VRLPAEIAEIRRERRKIRARLNAKWDEEGVRRPRWWWNLIIWAGAVLGLYLLLSGDTVERVIGIGLIVPPALITAASAWVYWKALRLLRQAERDR